MDIAYAVKNLLQPEIQCRVLQKRGIGLQALFQHQRQVREPGRLIILLPPPLSSISSVIFREQCIWQYLMSG